jgi:hypothetical protein
VKGQLTSFSFPLKKASLLKALASPQGLSFSQTQAWMPAVALKKTAWHLQH